MLMAKTFHVFLLNNSHCYNFLSLQNCADMQLVLIIVDTLKRFQLAVKVIL